jgi:hypothetical protein
MSLFEFIDFGDNNPTSAAPSGRPKTSTAKPPIDRPVGAKPPTKKQKVEPVVELPVEITPVIDQPSVDFNFNNSATIQYLKDFFAKTEKVGKENIICYAERKTMFGRKITATDKVKEIGIINAKHALSNKFISTTFKLITESEIVQVAKTYMNFGAVRHYPLLVEIEYIIDPKHNNVLIRIQDEFL